MSVADAVQEAMRTTNERFCREVIGEGSAEALGKVYTENARVLPPGADMIEGQEAIRGFWTNAIATLELTGATLRSVEVEMCGESAVEIGRAELHTKAGATVLAKYVVHWKQEDGEWRWDKDIWNMH